MKVIYTESFQKDYRELSTRIQRALDKALKFLLENPRHPSLQAKKLLGTFIWYARVIRACRFTLQFTDDSIILRRAGTHDILNRERKKSP